MITTQSYEVAIVGGGMVGLAAACALAQAGISTIVIDAQHNQAPTGTPSLRVSAINHASQRLLKRLGAWQLLASDRTAPYSHMSVWEKDGLGQIGFDASEQGQTALGSIIENDAISYALAQVAATEESLTHLVGVKLAQLAFGEREAWLTLDNGEQISAALVIGADGAESYVRNVCQIPLTFWDYGHHAIVATVKAELGHDATARQAFLADGVLAMLPLYEPELCSIVWSVSPAQANELMGLAPDEFGKRLTATLDGRLGRVELAGSGERQSFPLKMRYARQFAGHRMALIGDAAHTIHPLAGQGVNLGLLDAAALADTLSDLKQAGKDLGDYRHLREFERWRKAQAIEMIAAMEGFKQLFSGSNPVKRALRDLGLNLVDNAPLIKTLFMQQAMGNKGKLPRLCQ